MGSTIDSQVQRLLGQGVFRKDEGHTGGRYFLDLKRTATLHVEEGVDQVVEHLTIRYGVHPEIQPAERRAASTKWFDPSEGFGNYHALQLGATQKAVLDNLGEPRKKQKSTWTYESTCACELPAYLAITFESGRVTQIDLSEEE